MDDFCTEDGIDCGCSEISECEATTKTDNRQFSFYAQTAVAKKGCLQKEAAGSSCVDDYFTNSLIVLVVLSGAVISSWYMPVNIRLLGRMVSVDVPAR